MPINSFLYPGVKVFTPYEVANSLRFDDGSSDYLSRTMGTPTNTDKYTFSFWVKRSKLGSQQSIFRSTNGSATNDSHVTFQSDDTLRFEEYGGSSTVGKLQTNQLFRDVSAWFHIVLVYDSGNATAGNRMRMYVNGTEVTSFGTDTNPSQDADSYFNRSGETLSFGRTPFSGGANYFNGYVAEVVMCDGQALDPTSFGEYDSDANIWKPIDVSGLTFGNNGFYLDFENSSSLGADVSGNGNNFTVNNLTSIDQTTDTCTNNFATINSLDNLYIGGTLSEGNTKIVTGVSNEANYITSTIGVASGKWYCEVKNLTPSGRGHAIGISGKQCDASNDSLGGDIDGFGYRENGSYKNNGSTTAYGDSYTQNDIIGIALDLDNNKLYFSKNGTWQNSGDPTSGATGTGAISIGTPSTGFYFIALGDESGDTNTFETNFGNPPFSISSGNSDGNGYGNFEYSVPSGYYALNTKNLAEYG
jgi:hypothetical protein